MRNLPLIFSCAFGYAISQASEAAVPTAEKIDIIELESMSVRAQRLSELPGRSAGATTSGESEIYTWASPDYSIISVNNSLWVNDMHYNVPPETKSVWLIEGDVFIPKIGILKPTPVIDKNLDLVQNRREKRKKIVWGITFMIENGFYMQGGQVLDSENRYVSFGELFFNISKGRLIFRGIDYGSINKGDVVEIDKKYKVLVKRGRP